MLTHHRGIAKKDQDHWIQLREIDSERAAIDDLLEVMVKLNGNCICSCTDLKKDTLCVVTGKERWK